MITSRQLTANKHLYRTLTRHNILNRRTYIHVPGNQNIPGQTFRLKPLYIPALPLFLLLGIGPLPLIYTWWFENLELSAIFILILAISQ